MSEYAHTVCGMHTCSVPITHSHIHLPYNTGNNQISSLAEFSHVSLPHLETLDLFGNKIADIHELTHLQNLPKLLSLDVRENKEEFSKQDTLVCLFDPTGQIKDTPGGNMIRVVEFVLVLFESECTLFIHALFL